MFDFDARPLRPRAAFYALGASCAVLTACGGTGSAVAPPASSGSATTATRLGTSATTPSPAPSATPTPAPTAKPSPLALSTALVQFEALGATTNVTISGPSSTNYGAMTVTSSNTNIATAAVEGNGNNFNVTSVHAGKATITVVPSDGSAGAAHLTVQVETATIEPQDRLRSTGGVR